MFSILTDNRHGHHPIRRIKLQTIVLTISAGTWLAWSSFMFVVKIHY